MYQNAWDHDRWDGLRRGGKASRAEEGGEDYELANPSECSGRTELHRHRSLLSDLYCQLLGRRVPIFKLFKKGSRFRWDDDCQHAMTELKSAMTMAPVLVKLDFSPNALPIVLNVDASTTIGWGAVLSQIQPDGKVKPSRFESGIWNNAELKYNALKLEC